MPKDKIKEDAMELMLKQPYAITVAKHEFSVYENRILFKIIDVLQPFISTLRIKDSETGKHVRHLTVDEIKSINPSDFASQIEGSISKKYIKLVTPLGTQFTLPCREILPLGSKNHTYLGRALKSMTSRSIVINRRNEEGKLALSTYTNFFKEAKYNHHTSSLDIEISNEFLPELISLATTIDKKRAKIRDNYTSFSKGIAFSLSSKYAQRLYEFAAHYRDFANKNRSFTISLENCREYFNLHEKYKSPSEIVRNVFNPALSELRNKSDVWLKIIKPLKEGRRVVGWKTRVVARKKKSLPIFNATPAINPNKDQAKSTKSKPLKLVDQLVTKFKLSHRQADKLKRQIDEKKLHKELYEINLQILSNKIRSVGGYTAKVLGEKFNLKL